MKIVKEYPNGLFSWVDLMTTDIAGAKSFYHALFGWEAADQPVDENGGYVIFTLDGYTVAGGAQMSPEMQASGMPPVWSSYVNHDDADGIAEKVKAAGGSIMMEPIDVMDAGRMFFATDPGGASFGVWQPKDHIGAQVVNQPNSLVWNELHTRDPETCRSFYNAVFGWETKTDQGYTMLLADERIQAGMMQMDENWGEMPSVWAVYFLVEDVDAMTEKVKALGGNVIMPPTPAGDLGVFSIVQDPQGGTFNMMAFKGPVDAPPGH